MSSTERLRCSGGERADEVPGTLPAQIGVARLPSLRFRRPIRSSCALDPPSACQPTHVSSSFQNAILVVDNDQT